MILYKQNYMDPETMEIFQINALQQRYHHLAALVEKDGFNRPEPSGKHSAIRTWIARIFH